MLGTRCVRTEANTLYNKLYRLTGQEETKENFSNECQIVEIKNIFFEMMQDFGLQKEFNYFWDSLSSKFLFAIKSQDVVSVESYFKWAQIEEKNPIFPHIAAYFKAIAKIIIMVEQLSTLGSTYKTLEEDNNFLFQKAQTRKNEIELADLALLKFKDDVSQISNAKYRLAQSNNVLQGYNGQLAQDLTKSFGELDAIFQKRNVAQKNIFKSCEELRKEAAQLERTITEEKRSAAVVSTGLERRLQDVEARLNRITAANILEEEDNLLDPLIDADLQLLQTDLNSHKVLNALKAQEFLKIKDKIGAAYQELLRTNRNDEDKQSLLQLINEAITRTSLYSAAQKISGVPTFSKRDLVIEINGKNKLEKAIMAVDAIDRNYLQIISATKEFVAELQSSNRDIALGIFVNLKKHFSIAVADYKLALDNYVSKTSEPAYIAWFPIKSSSREKSNKLNEQLQEMYLTHLEKLNYIMDALHLISAADLAHREENELCELIGTELSKIRTDQQQVERKKQAYKKALEECEATLAQVVNQVVKDMNDAHAARMTEVQNKQVEVKKSLQELRAEVLDAKPPIVTLPKSVEILTGKQVAALEKKLDNLIKAKASKLILLEEEKKKPKVSVVKAENLPNPKWIDRVFDFFENHKIALGASTGGGGVLGVVLGIVFGLVPAIPTFGLSIIACAVLGGCLGVVMGAIVGMVGAYCRDNYVTKRASADIAPVVSTSNKIINSTLGNRVQPQNKPYLETIVIPSMPTKTLTLSQTKDDTSDAEFERFYDRRALV